MKLKIMSLVAAAGLFVASCTTSYNTTTDNAAYNVNVPTGIRSGFTVAYPDATNVVWNSYDINTVPIDWELSGWNALDAADYTVSFNMGDNQYYSFYDSDGNLVGTTYAVTDYTKVPYAVTSMLKDKYKDYTIDRVDTEIVGSKTAYEVKLTQGDNKIKLLVDANGNVLKEKMK
jgi:hypothetical protein